MRKQFLITLIITLLLASCIKDEPPFREADIVKFSLPDSVMGSAIYGSDVITVMVYDTTGFANKKIAPTIEVSEGATVYPNSGDSVLLDNYRVIYDVKPQDGGRSKSYLVEVVPFDSLVYDFERWDSIPYLNGKRSYFRLTDPTWINGNVGIAIIYSNNTPYPTRVTTDSHSGKYAALMETLKGKAIFKAPLFAGSLYRGTLKLDYANPSKSAKFGQILPKYFGKPMSFKGFYKYSPGAIFVEPDEKFNLKEVKDKVDECDIYAVLFRVTKGAAGKDEYLDANEIKVSDKVAAIAQLQDCSAKKDYTEFDIPFVYKEKLDYDQYDYKMAVSFTSSKEGAFFRGAIGSVLIVDDVEVVCEPYK